MALKALIHKANIELSDIDRGVYGEHAIMLARHPSETDERMLNRLLAFALNIPAREDDPPMEFAKDMWDAEQPALWQRDMTGQIVKHWIEVGQPDERRIIRTISRVERMTVYTFASSTHAWWKEIASKIVRARNLAVWQIPSEQSRAMAALSQRSMDLQVTIQDGQIWIGDGKHSIEMAPVKLFGE